MARFYGTVQGGRGKATRLGHATSGLEVSAQSYSGNVRVWLSAREDQDYVTISIEPRISGDTRVIYQGPVEQLLQQSGRKTMLQALALDELAA